MRSEFMIERQGKMFCLYAGLLDEAHQQGLKEIRTTLVQIPADENGHVAICQSQVTTEKGVFTGLGDAAPQNVARAMQTCLIRMAETRAKARALRDAVNVGVVALEELAPEGSGEQSDGHEGPSVGNGGPRGYGSGYPATAVRRPTRSGGFGGPGENSGMSSDPERIPDRAPVSERPVAPARAAGSDRAAASDRPRPVSVPDKPAGPDSMEEVNWSPRGKDIQSDGITPAQRRMLQALAEQVGETVDVDNLSRQQASQMITELKARLSTARAA